MAENIQEMLPELIAHQIPLYISDDSTNDETLQVINQLKRAYDAIYYRRNIPALRHDKNFIETLQWPKQSKYVWVLNDALSIKQGGITAMLQKCKYSNADFIIVTTSKRAKNIPARTFSNANDFATVIGWHITMTGATIFSRRQIDTADYKAVSQSANFPQAAFILRGILNSSFEAEWTGAEILISNKRKESYWIKNVFTVFLNDWIQLIHGLPQQYDVIKPLLYSSHAANTNLFSFRNLLYFRMKGALTWQQVWQYTSQIKLAAHQSPLLFFIVALLPAKAIATMVSKFKKAKSVASILVYFLWLNGQN